MKTTRHKILCQIFRKFVKGGEETHHVVFLHFIRLRPTGAVGKILGLRSTVVVLHVMCVRMCMYVHELVL